MACERLATTRHFDVIDGPRRYLGDGSVKRNFAMIFNDETIHAKGVRAPQDGAEVMGVLDSVQHRQKRILLLLGAFDERVQRN